MKPSILFLFLAALLPAVLMVATPARAAPLSTRWSGWRVAPGNLILQDRISLRNHNSALPLAQSGSAQLAFSPSPASVMVGNNVAITVNLAAVTDLYGYQLQVNYDVTKVSAAGAFVNGFFDTTTGAFTPGDWAAVCSSGACRFAATKVRPAAPISGSGALARIVFTGTTPGAVALTFTGDVLGDRDGNPLAHTTSSGTLNVNGTATITGTVTLQGRATPITSGTVTLTDTAGIFTPTVVNFDATSGQFSATVPVEPLGSTYNLRASHSLYLSNRKTGVAVTHASVVNVGTTQLEGGDANNDGTVDILDLSCIGGRFRSSPGVCGTDGSNDINADGIVDILDLTLAGGNYRLSTPQPW